MQPRMQPYNVHEDTRGQHSKFFMESRDGAGLFTFPAREVFMTTNHKNTIRGMHFQRYHAGAKIISCITGHAYVQIVNLVPDTPGYREVVLQHSLLPGQQITVPTGHALGYRALEDDTRILYITDQEHKGNLDVGFNPFSLNWSLHQGDLFEPRVSDRDVQLPSLKELCEEIETQDDPEDYLRGGSSESHSNWG